MDKKRKFWYIGNNRENANRNLMLQSIEEMFLEEALEREQKALVKGVAQGFEQGIEQGIEQTKLDMARELLENGVSWEIVLKTTGFTRAQLESRIKS